MTRSTQTKVYSTFGKAMFYLGRYNTLRLQCQCIGDLRTSTSDLKQCRKEALAKLKEVGLIGLTLSFEEGIETDLLAANYRLFTRMVMSFDSNDLASERVKIGMALCIDALPPILALPLRNVLQAAMTQEPKPFVQPVAAAPKLPLRTAAKKEGSPQVSCHDRETLYLYD